MPAIWGVSSDPIVLGLRGPHAKYTTSGGAAHPGSRCCFHTPHLPTIRRSVVCRDSYHGAANGDQSPADGRGIGSGASVNLTRLRLGPLNKYPHY